MNVGEAISLISLQNGLWQLVDLLMRFKSETDNSTSINFKDYVQIF